MYLYSFRAPSTSRSEQKSRWGGEGLRRLLDEARQSKRLRGVGVGLRTGSGAEFRAFFYRPSVPAVRRWWGSHRIEWRSKGGPGGWSVQSARRNNRLSARYIPSRYHGSRFTNVVHCYVLEKYRRSTLLAARTRARPPLVTYVVDVLTAVIARSFVR